MGDFMLATETPAWVDFAGGTASIVAAAGIFLGGVWALIRFGLFRETASNADFQVHGSHVVKTQAGLAMFVNVLLANRARTSLQIGQVEYKWHEITEGTALPPPRDSYAGPKPLIEEPQPLEPGKEAWGVVHAEVSQGAKGALLWVILSPRRVGLNKILFQLWGCLPCRTYKEPEVTEWTFFVAADQATQ